MLPGTWRVGGVLAMSRAFGNLMLKQFVMAESDIQVEEKQLLVADAEVTVREDAEATVGEETKTEVPLSEQMQLDIARIHEKIDSFTNLVFELMESGKSLPSWK